MATPRELLLVLVVVLVATLVVVVLVMLMVQLWTWSLAGKWVQPRGQTSSMWKHQCALQLPWVPQLRRLLTHAAQEKFLLL